MYYGGFTYTEARSMPMRYRTWFIDRIQTEFKKASDKGNEAPTKALHMNGPEERAMMGMSRTNAPSRMRRFT